MKIFDTKIYRFLEFYSHQVVVAGMSILLFDAVLAADWLVIVIAVSGILASCEVLRAKIKSVRKED